ncbi:MAG: tetratricopeptide repeat protein [Ottowia sp.]|nr:tetratricopeptide repeat protein [Ottowia sp.]
MRPRSKKPPPPKKAGSLFPAPIKEKYQQAFLCFQYQRFPEAIKLCREIIQSHPKHVDALHLLGIIALASQSFQEAVEWIRKAIIIGPANAVFYANLGSAYQALKQWDKALACCNEAIKLKPKSALAHFNRGNALTGQKHLDSAIASYSEAIALQEGYADAYFNRASLLQIEQKFDAAIADYDTVITLRSEDPKAYISRGDVLRALRQWMASMGSYDQAILLGPSARAYYGRGVALQELGQWREAIASYDQAFVLQPELNFLRGFRLHIRMYLCDWHQFDDELAALVEQVEQGKSVVAPFVLLALIDSLSEHYKAASIWISDPDPSSLRSIPIPKYHHKKIRIGYYSADFHTHATAHLMAAFFELHGGEQFELIAFSFGPDVNDAMRQRLMVAFDQFIDVRLQSDRQIAELSRSLEIDIAVDLKGFTQDARTGIFAHRAAPIQVNYLGYPGTMAADYIDYIVADAVLIPVSSQRYYAEKIVYLPHSYQVNDRGRQIADGRLSREESGLPTDRFVFCCFNHHYKITPNTFDGWMRILRKVDGSVLWLLEDQSIVSDHLRDEAVKRGVAAERLIFAKRLPLAEHLARHRLADLFIDTLPYGAHTTSSDALWAGVPVLTCMGESFASRVAASLLTAIDLPELITQTQEEYEALAISLATHPDQLMQIKQKLAQNRLTTPLFNTALFVEHLELAYQTMYARYQDDLLPEHIYIESLVN